MNTLQSFPRTLQYYKFCAYGFLKNLRLFDIFFILFFREAGLSFLQIGFLYSIRQITINILEIPSGLIADAIGRKQSLLFSMFAYLFSFIMFYVAEIYFLFSAAMILFGIGEAFRSGTHKAMILEYLKLNNLLSVKTRYYGSTRSWSQFGSAISSLLAMVVVFNTGSYRQLFIFSAVPYLLDFVLLSTYPRALNGKLTDGKEALNLRILINRFRHTFFDFSRMIRNGDAFQSIFSAATYIALYKTLKDYLQPVLKATALSLPVLMALQNEKRAAILVGLIYFAIFIINSIASRHAWRLETKFSNLGKTIDWAYLVGVLSVLAAAFFLIFNWQIAASVIFIGLYVIQNIRRPLVVSFLSRHISSNVMASGLSAESQLETILIALLAPVVGYLVDLLGLGGGIAISGLFFLAIYPLVRLQKLEVVK
ncbi:MAG: MFS transporter [Caldithrix sp.]|nr:MFS transporter [Caldithrix sp.]